MKKLVCFDIDGVLLDSRQNMSLAWSAVRDELGVSVPFERYFAEIGRPFGEIMGILGLGEQAAVIEAAFRRTSAATLADTPIYPGAGAMLEALQSAGSRLAIVTSKDRGRTDLVLKRLPVAFDAIRTPDESCRGKPAPDHLMMAMALCRTDPTDTVFVGDMDSDAEAAARAGIDYVHARWGYGHEPASCLAAPSDCADLTAFLLQKEPEERTA